MPTESIADTLERLCARLKGEFREEDHPRAEDGRFGDKPGAHGGGDKPEGEGKPTAEGEEWAEDDHPARRKVPYRPQTEEEIAKVQQFREDSRKVINGWVSEGASHLPEAQRAKYTEAMRKCFDYMPVPIAQAVMRNTGGVTFYADTKEITEAITKYGGKVSEGKRTGGFWSLVLGDRVGTLHLDGGSETGDEFPQEAREVYAHELGHALDAHNRYSNMSEWEDAWKAEIDQDGDPVSRYARTNTSEGFAEYHRLMNTAPGVARREFPKCWAFFKAQGLV